MFVGEGKKGGKGKMRGMAKGRWKMRRKGIRKLMIRGRGEER